MRSIHGSVGGTSAVPPIPLLMGVTLSRPQARLGRLERPALIGVLVREIVNYSSYWRAATFSSTVEPTFYLLAFGFGFGSLVSQIGGYDYVEFVGTGTVATAVLFSSAFPAMFGTFIKYQFQRTYDAILAAPVDTEELVTAEALWMAMRAGVYGCVPLLVAIAFGLDPAWGMLTVPGIAFVAGFGWACFGIAVAGFAKSIDNFSYIVSAVLTPLFLVAGTFFPLDGLPEWAQIAGELNPLHHCVELVRHAAFGSDGWTDAIRLGALVGFGLIMWRIAIRAMTRKLID
jgi:lipooligosaccharide transport system permease protein